MMVVPMTGESRVAEEVERDHLRQRQRQPTGKN